MKKVFVENIAERDQVEAPFLVKEKTLGMAKNGKPYMTLKLMDRTGEVEGRIWDRVDELSARFSRDDFVQVSAKASVYLGRMQLVIKELSRLDEMEIDLVDFLPVSARPADDMLGELTAVIDSLDDPDLKKLMQQFLSDPDFMAGYTRAPAAKAMHHVCLGGLLEHSLAVARLAADICRRYPDLDRDLLVVGALLHDIGKVAELRYQRSFEYTDAGKLLGHIIIGVEMVEEKIRALGDFPLALAVHLKHLLLSHHGQYEYGSPKRPKTMEAVILSFLDDLDSKINGVRTHIDREPDNGSSWTQYHKHYDRYFFKGSRHEQPGGIAAPEQDAAEAASPRPVSGKQAKQPRARFGNTLGEQLQSKGLDLLLRDGQERSDE